MNYLIFLLLLFQTLTGSFKEYNSLEINTKLNQSFKYNIGNFDIEFNNEKLQLAIYNKTGNIVWETNAGKAFINGAYGNETVKEDHGSFFIEDKLIKVFRNQRIDSIEYVNNSLIFKGILFDTDFNEKVPYTFTFNLVSDLQLSFEIKLDSVLCNRIQFIYYSDPL